MADITIRRSGRWTAVDYPEKDSYRLFSPETRIKEYFDDFRANFKDLEKDSKALEEKCILFMKKIQTESQRPKVESGLCFACVKSKRELIDLKGGASVQSTEATGGGPLSFLSSLRNYIFSFFTRYLPQPEVTRVTNSGQVLSKATMTHGDPTNPPKDAKFCDCDNYPEITQTELEKIIARVSREEKSSS